MRIGYDGRVLSKGGSGIVRYSYEFLEHMLQRHPENEYFLYLYKKDADHMPLQLALLFAKKNLTIRIISWPRPLWRTALFTAILDSDRIDVFHSMAFIVPFVPAWARKVRIIHTSHGINPTETWSSLKDRLYWVPNLRLECAFSDHIIAMSQDCKNVINEHYKVPSEQISVGYFGLNPNMKPISKAEKTKAKKYLQKEYNLPKGNFILYVGGMLRNKNVATIIETFRVLKEKGLFKAPIIIARTTEEYIKPLLPAELTTNDIIPIPWIDNEDIIKFYNVAEITIYASTWDGLGYPICESLACGTPVVASDTPAFREAGGDGAIYVNDPKDSIEWALRISGLWNNKKKQKKLAKLGMKHVKKFNWNKVVDDAIESYKKALAGK